MKRLSVVLVVAVALGGYAKEDKTPTGTPEGVQVGGTPKTITKTTPAMPGYEVKLKELQDKVTLLKDKVFEAKTRLMLLREQILHNLVAEAKLTIIHSNDVGMFLELKKVAYYLDGDKIYGMDKASGSAAKKEFVIYSGSVAPTHHILNVEMIFEGRGGLFSYLSGYRFRVTGSLPFYAAKGKEVIIKVVGYQKGGLTRLEESPSIRFEVKRVNLTTKMIESSKGGK